MECTSKTLMLVVLKILNGKMIRLQFVSIQWNFLRKKLIDFMLELKITTFTKGVYTPQAVKANKIGVYLKVTWLQLQEYQFIQEDQWQKAWEI